jgi:hypothetical protein
MPLRLKPPVDRSARIGLMIIGAVLLALVVLLVWERGSDDGPLERAGENIEDAADDVGDAIEDAGDDLKKKLDP